MYDYLIIGSGVAGLYFAYKYLLNKNYKFAILDKRDYIGGRILTTTFYGTKINLGAAIIYPHHHHLIRLIKELKIEYKENHGEYRHEYKDLSQDDINTMMDKIKNTYLENKNEVDKLKLTMEEFINIYFPNDFVTILKNICDFQDFWCGDVASIIGEYPYNELISKYTTSYSIKGGYGVLIDKLVSYINTDNIKLNQKVIIVEKIQNSFKVTTNNINTNTNEIYETKKLIICGDIDVSYIQFINITGLYDIFNSIGSVPFMRIYSYHDKVNIKTSIRTTSPLSKMYKITDNIMLSGYMERHEAELMFNLIKKLDSDSIKHVLDKLIKKSITIDPTNNVSEVKNFLYKYWKHVVHYFKPGYNLDQNQLIQNNILIAGEMVSNYQGWVEGAIQSVDDSSLLFQTLEQNK